MNEFLFIWSSMKYTKIERQMSFNVSLKESNKSAYNISMELEGYFLLLLSWSINVVVENMQKRLRQRHTNECMLYAYMHFIYKLFMSLDSY